VTSTDGRSDSDDQAAGRSKTAEVTQEPTAPADPLTGLIQNGLALLEQFVDASRARAKSQTEAAKPSFGGIKVVQDEEADQAHLRIPLPKPEVMEKAVQALAALLKNVG
jgi:hypothetical protein